MKLEILGTGCPKCESLLNHVKTAVAELGIEAEISKVSDIVEIAERGALMTPALSIDGEIKLAGKLASVEELKTLIGS